MDDLDFPLVELEYLSLQHKIKNVDLGVISIVTFNFGGLIGYEGRMCRVDDSVSEKRFGSWLKTVLC